MEITLAAQTITFLQAIVLGVCCGVIYDGCRALRRVLHAGMGLTALLDAVFCLAALLGLFVFAVIYAVGQMRGYVLVGEGIGLALYFLSLSTLLLPAMEGVLRLAGWLLWLPVRLYQRLSGFFRRRAEQSAAKQAQEKNQ